MADWDDPKLLQLRRRHLETLQAWDAVRGDPLADAPGSTPDEVAVMTVAMEAERAYFDAMRELGLMG